ncbi:MAG: carbon-nitrogen hydrolase family protein [Acidobacteriota bacterium]
MSESTVDPTPYLAAVVQMNSGSDAEGNWRQAKELIDRAAGYGARWIGTPENTPYLGPHHEKVRLAEDLDGPTCGRFANLAARHGIHLLLGSFAEKAPAPGKCYNTSVLFDPQGQRLAVYRKIHLFDVELSAAVTFRESDTVEPGTESVTVPTDLGTFGLSVCYDLRFPELYRRLVDQGAHLLTVPAAFTLTTGRAHWLPLLRARAIETQCWVLAPAQHGEHDDKGLRESFGHACLVDPWGQVVADAPDGPGLALAEVDLGKAEEVRRGIPVGEHRRITRY